MQQETAAVTAQWTEFVTQVLRDVFATALGWALMFGLAGFAAAMVAAIAMARGRRLRREPRPGSARAKLASAALIAGFTLVGAAAGAVYGAQRESQEVLRTAVRPVIAGNMPAYREYVAGALSGYVPDQRVTVRELIEPYIRVYHYVPASDSAWERAKARAVNGFLLPRAADVFIDRFQSALIAYTGVSGGDSVRFTAQQMSDFFAGRTRGADRQRMDTVLPAAIVNDLGERLNAYCGTLYLGIAAVPLGVLLWITLETILYRRFRRGPPVKPCAGARTPQS